MMHRAIKLQENGRTILSHDNRKVNGNDVIEKDIVHFINVLEEKGIINKQKLFNYLRTQIKGVGIIDVVDIVKNPNDWNGLANE